MYSLYHQTTISSYLNKRNSDKRQQNFAGCVAHRKICGDGCLLGERKEGLVKISMFYVGGM